MRYPSYIEADFRFPDFYRVRMTHKSDPIPDAAAAVRNAMATALETSPVSPGETVAVGVGSRGITRLPEMVGAMCGHLKEIGARPFIIPAMGSHGGAADDGQAAVLASLGVNESACGAPVRSRLAVQRIGTAMGEMPVLFSEDALAADHSICINRIKPHTKFKAAAESGIFKMLCIGMGKHDGALAFHRYALKHGFFPLLAAVGDAVVQKSNFRFGIAAVEDGRDQPTRIEALAPPDIVAREKDLLKMAEDYLPRLPARTADVLVIGNIGKEISGAGMDPNITGRACDLMESDFSGMFHATRVAILNLSEASKGNAIGLGNADIITEKVWETMDYEATVMNALTGISLRKAAIPVRLPTDRKAIQACFTTIGPKAPDEVRAFIIRDTRHLSEIWASTALKDEIAAHPAAEILDDGPLPFDEGGNLLLFD